MDQANRSFRGMKLVASIGVGVLIAAWLVWVLEHPSRDESLTPESLPDWLADLESEDPKTREVAERVFATAGTNAFPLLEERFKWRESQLSSVMNEIAALAGVRRESSTSVNHRQIALGFQAVVGGDTNYVPALRELFLNDRLDGMIRGVFVSMGSVAVPHLVEMLSDPDAQVRANAAESLRYFGPSAAVAVPDLISAARDRESRVRMSAIAALRAINPPSEDVVMVYADALMDGKPAVYENANRALAGMGAAAKPALSALTNALKHPDAGFRRDVSNSLQVIHAALQGE